MCFDAFVVFAYLTLPNNVLLSHHILFVFFNLEKENSQNCYFYLVDGICGRSCFLGIHKI